MPKPRTKAELLATISALEAELAYYDPCRALARCRNCGSVPELSVNIDDYQIMCLECRAAGPVAFATEIIGPERSDMDRQREAVRLWNLYNAQDQPR
jgi:hypothetical protein